MAADCGILRGCSEGSRYCMHEALSGESMGRAARGMSAVALSLAAGEGLAEVVRAVG